jgi:ribosome-binding protein aMBF1 (putative translation factor)
MRRSVKKAKTRKAKATRPEKAHSDEPIAVSDSEVVQALAMNVRRIRAERGLSQSEFGSLPRNP